MMRSQLTAALAQPRGTVDGGEVVRLFGAIEQVARALEPDWAQYFSDRLSGPDGLELVVEVAHDLRSPLTSILFLAETIQRGRSGPLTPVQERQLGLIYSAAFGLSSVASDVIELARGRRPAGGSRPDPLLGSRHLRIGARHRAADRGREGARGARAHARRRFPRGPSGGAEPGCC
jgi:signal transduction histidine kinase